MVKGKDFASLMMMKEEIYGALSQAQKDNKALRQALADLVAAAEPVVKKNCAACPALRPSGYRAEFEPAPPCDDCDTGPLSLALERARKVMKEEA